jgi:hypothetical protein
MVMPTRKPFDDLLDYILFIPPEVLQPEMETLFLYEVYCLWCLGHPDVAY